MGVAAVVAVSVVELGVKTLDSATWMAKMRNCPMAVISVSKCSRSHMTLTCHPAANGQRQGARSAECVDDVP